MSSYALIVCTVLVTFLCAGCSNDTPTTTPTPAYMVPAPATVPSLPLVRPNTQTLNFWALQQQAINNSQQRATQLLATVEALLQNPTAKPLKQCQEQWQQLIITLDETTLIHLLSQQIAFPASKKILKAYKHLGLGHAHLGYLDDDGQHGKTGLIFDIDIAINADNLKQQQQLTGPYDLTLGAAPLGAMLLGINGKRTSDDFLARPALTNDDRVKGYTQAHELAENRRRELILVQSQTLLATITRLQSLWQNREHDSFINAFSQLTTAAQTVAYLQATLILSQQQLEQLQHDKSMTEWTDEDFKISQQQLHYQRWQAQQRGISKLAKTAQLSWLESHSESIQTLLQQLINTPAAQTKATAPSTNTEALTTPQAFASSAMTTSEATSSTPDPATSTAKNLVLAPLQQALEALINDLIKSLDMPPQAPTNNSAGNSNSTTL